MLNTKKWRCFEHKSDECDSCKRYLPLTDTCDTTTTECVIDGKRQPYDRCSDEDYSLQYSIDYYKEFDYIGSGYELFINGKRNLCTKKYYFFVYKNIQRNRKRKLEKIQNQ